MSKKIFYKFFIIIFVGFLFVEVINIKIDYETTLNYKLGLFVDKQEKELSEKFASFMKDKKINEELFYNEFHQQFDHEGYCYHTLVKDEPINFIDLQKIEHVSYFEHRDKAKKILLEYDNDKIILNHHGVNQIQPYISYFNQKTDTYETVQVDYEIVSDVIKPEQTTYYYQNECEVYVAENSEYTYHNNGIGSQKAQLINHLEYKDICNSYIHQYQIEKDYENTLYFYDIYKEGVIFITKTYIASYDGHQFYRINEEMLNTIPLTNCITNEHMRYLKGLSDYYVYSFFYMDSLSLMSEIDDEINERNMLVYISVLFVSFFVSLVLSWMLTRRIKCISEATTQIANNDFTISLQSFPKDELGILSSNINTMSQKLNKTMTQLNNEIERVVHLEGLRKEFIANFTHEIKTPLGIINGYIELIIQSKDESKKSYYLEGIQKETSRINILISEMLDLSRLEAGRIELNKQEVDLEDLTCDLLESFFPLLRKKSIKVRVNVNDAIILADKKEITKVISNLLSNAIAHTKDNGRMIVTYENQVFSVENEGEPLTEDAMRNVFESYISHNREGTGLGLAICKAILELHEFNFGVKNTKNGVCFWFET